MREKNTCDTVIKLSEQALIKKVREYLNNIFIIPSQIAILNKALLDKYDVNVVKFSVDYEINKFTFTLTTNLSNMTHCISVDTFR